jgi:hypothetical protein
MQVWSCLESRALAGRQSFVAAAQPRAAALVAPGRFDGRFSPIWRVLDDFDLAAVVRQCGNVAAENPSIVTCGCHAGSAHGIVEFGGTPRSGHESSCGRQRCSCCQNPTGHEDRTGQSGSRGRKAS